MPLLPSNPYRLTVLFAALGLFGGMFSSLAQSQSALERKGLGGLTPVPFAKLSDTAIRRLGKTALAIEPSAWQHSETENFVYHYRSSHIATPVSVEAEFYYRVIAKDLGQETGDWERKSHIFIFEDSADWNQFQTHAHLDPWTGGIHAQGELFIQRNPAHKYKGRTLGHEVVHLILHRFYGATVPLWVNEGYAEYGSSKAYAAFYRARGYSAKPTSDAVPPARFIPLKQLVEMVDYPQDPKCVNVFYDESHRLVRFLSAESKTKFSEFLKLLSTGKKCETALFRVYRGEFPSLSALEREFKTYAIKDYE